MDFLTYPRQEDLARISMSPGDQQAWLAASAAVAAPPPKTNAIVGGEGSSAPTVQSVAPVLSQWDLFYHNAAPGHRADLLTLANQSGLLHGYHLPQSVSPRALLPADAPRASILLHDFLSGKVNQLEPVRATALEFFDQQLDETQRHAVASALATPDLFLIRGMTGTGKSRVAAEIVTQAAKRGDRVLLLGASSAALDRILEQIAQRQDLCSIRCLAPEEDFAQLPASIRALTLQERAAALRNNSLRTARETRQAAELQCARRRHEASLWTRLEELCTALPAARETVTQAEAKLASVPAEVTRDAEAPSGRVADHVRSLRRSGEEQLSRLSAEIATAERACGQEHEKLAELERKLAVVEPLASAKRQGRWWSPRWWKAVFKGRIADQLALLEAQRQQIQAAIAEAGHCLQELARAREVANANAKADVQSYLENEVSSRQQKLLNVFNLHRKEFEKRETLWSDLCLQIQNESLRPTAQSPQAVRAAKDQWLEHRKDDEARCAFAREWAEFLESSSGTLAAKLPGFANIVAATPSGLGADSHFGDAGASGGQFDLLVLEEADRLTESEFLKAAGRARQWVLLGDVSSSLRLRADGATAKGKPSPWFARLWQHVHCDPSALRHAWFLEGQSLGCRLRQLTPVQRQKLENEPLADAPDVELRIFTAPGARPELAEVVFPGTMSVPTAKEFLFRELQEVMVQTTGRSLRRSESTDVTVLTFAPVPANAQIITLDSGVREYLDGQHLDNTCKLEFDRSAGWDRRSVDDWIRRHLGLVDLGRTELLEKQYRMAPALVDVVYDLLGAANNNSTAPVKQDEPAVEFVSVQGAAKAKGTSRSDSRGPRKVESTGPRRVPATGAGLELDLASLRPTDRVPEEVRSLVPGLGIVNLAEARAVVRKLEELLSERQNNIANAIAVIALYPTQAELIRRLIGHSPKLSRQASSIAVGPPSSFRQREADVVVISLTRSHASRAVAYGEGPAALELSLTRARRRLVLVGDSGNLLRRSQWRGALDYLDESAANHESSLIGRLVGYLQGRGRFALNFVSS
jgi:hypothetical protein